MDKVRRKHALEHKYELLNKALKSEKHARKGEFIDLDFRLMTMSPLNPCGKPCSRGLKRHYLLPEAPSSSQRAQGNNRLIVISLP